MTPLTHAAILSSVALVFAILHVTLPRWRSRPGLATQLAALTVLAPVPFVLASPEEALWTGKEGVIEAISEGLLLFAAGVAIARRNVWVAVGAALLLLEEIDYGQLFISAIPTPESLERMGSWSSNLNSHNLPFLGAAWRLVPLLAVLALSRMKAPPLGLPRLHPVTTWAVVSALALSVPAVLLSGGDRWNESFELGLVAVAVTGWLCAGDDSASD